MLNREFSPDRFVWPDKCCANGHNAPRYISNGACYECQAQRRAKYRASDKGRSASQLQFARYYQRNKQSLVDAANERRAADPSASAKASTKWKAKNADRVAAYARDYVRANRAIKAAAAARYSARKRRAIPAWADQAAIRSFYVEAARLTALTGVEHEVDHVLPLAGRTVCGLHVETNLRVIPAVDNRRKYNKFSADIQGYARLVEQRLASEQAA
ncbi:hypothetical protein CA235_07340 [Sphingomonas sp. ABOLF]|uniref:hypothetical protein n=1 Tax=Sphingomonas sp. ABOLF TaxID=1985879 RepID=UPI000F7F7554|nr:hypothetical protein [Sphingomonas sp. ABOLF]RSV15660.1 hypothetical protein CA235_07340 [Sphingomonas sp. ABOLF]